MILSNVHDRRTVDDDIESLWLLAKAFWTQPGVEAACLAWQERFGLDVSFLIWAGWSAAVCNITFSEEALRGANAAVAEWRSGVIEPARAARKAVRRFAQARESPDGQAVYRNLRRVELMAERIEQRLLLAWMDGRPPSPEKQGAFGAMKRAIESTGGCLDECELTRLRNMADQFEQSARSVVSRRSPLG